MKAFVFSIGERTTDLCCQLMREYGYDVVLFQDQTSLWAKLERFYTEALQTSDNLFIRIDADIIPNKNIHDLKPSGWECASGFDWYKQDRGAISIHLMTREIIEKCLANIAEAENALRPETHIWRHPDINPFTKVRTDISCGIHGYGQSDQRERIKKLKYSRNQHYDWDLVEKIEALS